MRAWIVVGAVVVSLLPLQRAGAGAEGRGYVSGYFALALDGGKTTGFLQSVSGGATSAVVIEEEASSSSPFVKKHIGTPKYEDFTMEMDPGALQPVRDWIDAMCAAKPMRKSGEVRLADINRMMKRRAAFRDALLTELTIPACDATSKDPAYMTLKFAPESTQWTDGLGETLPAPRTPANEKWFKGNFHLVIGALPCQRVNKIESFSIKMKVVEDPVGGHRDVLKEPGKLEFPNLKITLSAVDAKPWLDWHEDFVIKQNNGQDKELTGSLTFLAPDLGTELMTIEFKQVGIFRLAELPETTPEKNETRLFVVELYVESMNLK